MQRTLGRIHFEEQLFRVICSAKQAHNLLGVGDKVWEACGSYRNWGCGKQETWTSNLLNAEDQWVVMVFLHDQHQKAKIFWQLRVGAKKNTIKTIFVFLTCMHTSLLLFLFSLFPKSLTSTAIDRLSIISKSNLTDKIKRCFFQAAVMSILLYGCITWTLAKQLENKLDSNYTRMLRAILNKSWQ